jgi:Holliday junction resolvase RusA-like endonuclease
MFSRSDMEVTFTVPGEPRGKGRPRFTQYGRAYTDSETRAYEKKVIAYYRQSLKEFRFGDDEYVAVEVTAVYPIPKSATKKSLEQIAQGKLLPKKKPDIDNVLKIVLDSLNGYAYRDDAQVVEVLGRKKYGAEPCVIITLKGFE